MKKLLILLCLLLAGCKTIEILAGIGAGASVAGVAVPYAIASSRGVSPREILKKIDEAYQEYDTQVGNIMNNVGLTPRERERLIKEKTRGLRSRIKDYNRLLVSGYGLPQEIIETLSGPEGQEFIGVIAKALPPPWNEVFPLASSIGLGIATVFGLRGRSRFRNFAVLMGHMVEQFKRLGFLSKDQVKTVAATQTSEARMSMTDFHNFLKRYNIS